MPIVLLAATGIALVEFEGRGSYHLVLSIFELAYLPFSALIGVVVYQALRTAKEGPAIETLSEVFA